MVPTTRPDASARRECLLPFRIQQAAGRAHLSMVTLQSSSMGSSISSKAFRARCAASARFTLCAGFLPGDVVRPSALVTCGSFAAGTRAHHGTREVV